MKLTNENKELLELKTQRFYQITAYITLIKNLKNTGDIRQLQTDQLPNYPSMVKKQMDKQGNFVNIRLSPDVPDEYIRGTNPLFSLKRHKWDPDFVRVKGLSLSLHESLKDITAPSPADQCDKFKIAVYDAYCSAYPDKTNKPFFDEANSDEEKSARLTRLIELMQTTLHEKTGKANSSLNITLDGKVLDSSYLSAFLGIDLEKDQIKDFIESITNATIPSEFWSKNDENVFDTLSEAEELSMAVQFFLGEVNIYCHQFGLSSSNFGLTLDEEPHCTDLAGVLKTAITEGSEVETTLINYINTHQSAFNLARPLN